MAILSLAMLSLMTAAASAQLKVLKIGTTPGGYAKPARGWGSWGIQSGGYLSSDDFNQQHIQPQCDAMASTLGGLYTVCALDSGWSFDGGDNNGVIRYNSDKFDLPNFANHLHSQGQQLGVYVVPGAFTTDYDKYVAGTNTTIRDICDGDYSFGRCYLKYDHPDTQKWFDSNAKQFAAWGVDYIKLDFITPGSPNPGTNLRPDSTGEVIGWHKAIANSGRKIFLDISWKLDRSKQYFDVWEKNADAMRVDVDLNTYSSTPFTSWDRIQKTIEQYRQWAVTALSYYDVTYTHPDLDDMMVGNAQYITGLTDDQRRTVFLHWIGASALLKLGSDLTKLDSYGISLLTNVEALSAADFTARYAMQPRNPGNGKSDPQQLQAWIAGPSPSKEIIVLLTNYGKDQGSGGWGGGDDSTQTVTVSWADLGVSGPFTCRDVLSQQLVASASGLSASLNTGASNMYRCTRGSGGGGTTPPGSSTSSTTPGVSTTLRTTTSSKTTTISACGSSCTPHRSH